MPELVRLAHERTAGAVVQVSLLQASAEHLPFADAVFDTIVMTWMLCSAIDVLCCSAAGLASNPQPSIADNPFLTIIGYFL